MFHYKPTPRSLNFNLTKILDFFQILAYNSKTMHPTEDFTPTKMKVPKVSRQRTYLKAKISSADYPQSIVKDRQFLPTYRKSEFCSLGGHSSNF